VAAEDKGTPVWNCTCTKVGYDKYL